MKEIKNKLIFLFYTTIIGCITGSIIWLFLRIMHTGIYFIWDYLPNKYHIPFYTIIVCLIGALILGLWKQKNGDYPDELETVIKSIKEKKRYPYNNIISLIICSLTPLLIGSSVGPEAGLTGIIAGLCTWVSDKLKKFSHELEELNSIGVTATLGTIFHSPMFGFVEPLEKEEGTKLPKTSKIIVYFIAILSSFGIFILLNNLFGKVGGFESFSKVSHQKLNYLYIFLLIIIGILGGIIYNISHKYTKKASNLFKDNILIKCIIGGLILGICGTILPLTMFSGEEQISTIMTSGLKMGVIVLLITGIVKIILTNICIEFGLKGGHFFPLIFSGVSIGYGMSILLEMNSIIAMAIVCASLMSNIMRKPIAVTLLLMILFPPSLIPIIILSSILSCLIDTSKMLNNQAI